jgi:hypothetical protein
MRTLIALIVALGLFAQVALAQGQVWFVSNGLEFGHFDTLQGAVDAAGDGDLIVVRRGHYAPFTIDNKSLIVAAEFPESVWVETVLGNAITIKNLSAARSTVVSDINVFKFGADAVSGVLLIDNQGAVQLERMVVGTTKIHPVQQSLRVISCDDVEIVDSGFAQGVLTRLSDVRFHECHIQGAEGVGCVTTPPRQAWWPRARSAERQRSDRRFGHPGWARRRGFEPSELLQRVGWAGLALGQRLSNGHRSRCDDPVRLSGRRHGVRAVLAGDRCVERHAPQ